MTLPHSPDRSRVQDLTSRLHAAFGRIATLLVTLLANLRREPEPVRAADHYVRFLRESANRGASNLVFAQRTSREEFQRRLNRTDYWQWVQSADYHYFISRALSLRSITEYSLFASHQCVENYLKAYIRCRRRTPPMSHDLVSLLMKCRATAPARDLFIFSDQATVVAERYNPFYELARYPVHTVTPGTGSYVILAQQDLTVLDYFVYRMRRVLPAPPGAGWDILTEGSFHLFMCQQQFPHFYASLYTGNLNFGNSF